MDAARFEVAARGLRHGLLETVAVGDELLDGEGARDRTKRTLEDLLDHGLDLAVGLPDEPLGGGPEPLRLSGDLEHSLTGDEHANALLRHGRVLVGESDLDLTRRELKPADLVHEGPGECARADDDLHALVVDGDEFALLVADLAPTRARDHERLVRTRDPIPLRGEQCDKDEYGDRR